MKKSETLKKMMSILGLLIVLTVIIVAFIFRKKIEQYAMTGYFGVFVACFAATATILLPAPGIIVVIQYSQFLNPVLVIILGGLGTSLGEMIGYLLGRTGKEIINISTDKKILDWFAERTYMTIFVFSLIPLPLFDVVGVVSGMRKINAFLFWITCLVGKITKMTIYVIIYWYAKELLFDFL